MLKMQKFVEDKLSNAEYRLDDSVKEWCGWIKGFPGVYAQGDSVESVRQDLAEMLEEYVFVSLLKDKKVKGLNIQTHQYA